MENKRFASPKQTGARKIFSTNEEEIIGKFLISSWKNKLRVPHEVLYETLQKHLEKYPRPSKCKDNKPSSIWRMKFFERNPAVQEAYAVYKATASRNFDLVSDQLISSFLQDLAFAEMPPTVKMPLSVSSVAKAVESQFVQSTDQDADIQRGILNIKKKKRHSLSTKPFAQSSESDTSVGVSGSKHERAKTVHAVSVKDVTSEKLAKTKEKARNSVGLKLSSKLFLSNKQSPKADPKKLGTTKQMEPVRKEKLSKKTSSDSPASKGTKQVMPSDAVPLEPVKYEEGANIEAMDCGKWYKAKIVEVDQEKKEILVHFNGWGKRFDTVFPMSSTLIRGITQLNKKPDAMKYKVGDDVLSQWSDGNFYPGTVMALRGSGSYVVMFYDGLKKLVRPAMLKPITEKEKEASLKAAQKAYLMSLETKLAEPEPKQTLPTGQNYRRYRTSATDRGKRISARLSSDDSSAPPAMPVVPKRAKKRKHEETTTSPADGQGESPGGGGNEVPESHAEKFEAKKARLDKLTHTLLDKVTTSVTPSTSATAVSTLAGDRGTTETSSSSTTLVADDVKVQSPQRDVTFSYDDSDGSDAPLVIDEDRDGKFPKLSVKKGSAKSKQVTRPQTSSAKRRESKKKGDKTEGHVVDSQKTSSLTKPLDENLQKLADAALSVSSAVSSDDNPPTPGSPLTGKKRKEASEALLQLSLFSYNNDKTSSEEQREDTSATLEAKNPKDLTESERLGVAVGRVLKGGLSLIEAAEVLDVNVTELRETLLQRPGIISGSSSPRFMSVAEEDDVINWIHDVTDLGWGISDEHICQRVKLFLAEHSYSVVFNNASPVNFPSKTWLSEFLERHPEIFPGRKRPLARFRCDREGFEDWLVRWLAMLRSYDIFPNAVYYCDELVFDASPKLLHDVNFTHGEATLEMAAPKSKITTLTCIGANGDMLPTFHVFPENSKGDMTKDEKLGTEAALANSGTLSSDLFHHWLKSNFMQNATKHRSTALLLDWRLDEVDFDVLKLAEENQIILFRFLPSAAHFLQHPDQKLFGRLRQQWKKSLISKFMKQNTSCVTSTAEFAKFFNDEFRKVATPSTVKMCYELTKLYTPMSEAEILALKKDAKVMKDKRNKRKRSKPVAYVGEESVSAKTDLGKKIEQKTEDNVEATDATQGNTALAADDEDKESSILNDSNVTDISSVSSEVGTPSNKESKETNKAPEASSIPFKKSWYSKGETVLAKWSDCRLYLATILKRLDQDKYKIRYFDGLVKTVKDDFLRPWNGKMPILPIAPEQTVKLAEEKSPKDERGRGKRVKKKTEIARAASVKRRRTTSSGGTITGMKKQQSSSVTAGSEKNTNVPQTVFTPPDQRITYKKGETVLCRWTNRRMYPATVLRQVDEDHYLVKYYDERKKVVKYTWLSPWKPTTAQQATSTPVVSVVDANDEKTSVSASKTLKAKLINAKTPSIIISKVKVPLSPSSGNVLAEKKSEIQSGGKYGGTSVSGVINDGSTEADAENEESTEEKYGTAGDDVTDVYGFKLGDTVLARWTDCRSYPATVRRRLKDGQYEVQYYDGMKLKVKPNLLRKWDPTALPRPLARQRKRTSSKEGEKATGDQRTEFSDDTQQAPGKHELDVAHGHIPKPPFHKDFAVESELNKFKCRVPGCNKVFRKESVLQQHHRHYHLQRYKLRDQETPVPPKRKASKDEPTAIKRRVSDDYYATMSPHPDATHSSSGGERGMRSRGGKPPIDRMKMTSLGVTSSSPEDRSMLSPNDSGTAGGDGFAMEKISPHGKSKRKRSGASPHDVEDGEVDPTSWGQQGDSAASDTEPKGTIEVVNEDIIQCVCGEEEEEGFMLQCESCFTWQHAVCEGISPPPDGVGDKQGANEGPKVSQGYVCSTCKNPPGVRRTRQFLYNTDFLTKGKLPSLMKFGDDAEAESNTTAKEKSFQQIMMVTNRLMDEVGKMQEALYGIRLKIDVADPQKEHHLLRLWKDDDLTKKYDVTPEKEAAGNEAIGLTQSPDAENIKTNDADSISIFQTVKSVIVRIVESVTGQLSPNRDSLKGDTGNIEGGMDVDQQGAEKTGNTNSITESSELFASRELNQSKVEKPENESDLWKPLEIKRTLVALSDLSKKELETDTDTEEMLKGRSNLLAVINHLQDSLDAGIIKLTEYVTATEAAFERFDRSPPSSTHEETTTSIEDHRLGELQSDIGAIHNSLDAVQRLLTPQTCE